MKNPTSIPATAAPIIPLLPYQRADVESNARFRWNCWARQTGKSFTKSLRRILRGMARRRNQIFLSAGERQSRELMDKARRHCQALKMAADFYDDRRFHDMSVRQLEIVLPGGVRIIGLPANPETARGFTGDVLLDEFAMHVEDREIWAAMFPTLLRGEGELDVASTPRGRGNMFDKLRDNDLFEHTALTLPDAIAQGLDVDEETMRDAMGDNELYRQEFLCEFLDESTAFLTYDQIAACVDESLVPHTSIEPLARESRELFVGVDIGRKRDLTVFWVLAREGRELITIGVITLASAPFARQSALLTQLVQNRRVMRCCIDAGGLGMQLAEEAVQEFGAHRVQALTFTPALKSQMAVAMRVAIEARRLHIPNDEKIINDFHSIERRVSAGGHFLLGAPRTAGSHADRFWAAALAVHAAGESAPARVESLMGAQPAFAREGTWN